MTFLVKWAWKTGKLPDEVQDLYDKRPANFHLLMAYEMYEAEREKKLIEEEKKKLPKPR